MLNDINKGTKLNIRSLEVYDHVILNNINIINKQQNPILSLLLSSFYVK